MQIPKIELIVAWLRFMNRKELQCTIINCERTIKTWTFWGGCCRCCWLDSFDDHSLQQQLSNDHLTNSFGSLFQGWEKRKKKTLLPQFTTMKLSIVPAGCYFTLSCWYYSSSWKKWPWSVKMKRENSNFKSWLLLSQLIYGKGVFTLIMYFISY